MLSGECGQGCVEIVDPAFPVVFKQPLVIVLGIFRASRRYTPRCAHFALSWVLQCCAVLPPSLACPPGPSAVALLSRNLPRAWSPRARGARARPPLAPVAAWGAGDAGSARRVCAHGEVRAPALVAGGSSLDDTRVYCRVVCTGNTVAVPVLACPSVSHLEQTSAVGVANFVTLRLSAPTLRSCSSPSPHPRTFAVSLWRVKAGFHTLPQVSVGAVVGAVDAVCWYHFCQVYFSAQARTHSPLVAGAERLLLAVWCAKALPGDDVAWLTEQHTTAKLPSVDAKPEKSLCKRPPWPSEMLDGGEVSPAPPSLTPSYPTPVHQRMFTLLKTQVRAFFGGTDIPVGLAIGVCAVTFLTFGNAQRKISKILSRKKTS